MGMQYIDVVRTNDKLRKENAELKEILKNAKIRESEFLTELEKLRIENSVYRDVIKQNEEKSKRYDIFSILDFMPQL